MPAQSFLEHNGMTMNRYTIGVLVLLVMGIHGPAAAQVAGADTTSEIALGSPWPSVAAGLGVGAVGLIGGAAFGASLAANRDFGALMGAYLGAAVGMSMGMAIGVHVGNRQRGDAGRTFLAGLGFSLVAPLLLGYAIDDASADLFLLVPLTQVWVMTAVERTTARSRLRDRRWSVGIGPDGNGRVALGVGLRF